MFAQWFLLVMCTLIILSNLFVLYTSLRDSKRADFISQLIVFLMNFSMVLAIYHVGGFPKF